MFKNTFQLLLITLIWNGTQSPLSHANTISDEEWKNIVGSRIDKTYPIARGDTLLSISKKLFGNSKYWKKLWVLNNDLIANPYHLKTGTRLKFTPGRRTNNGTEIASALDLDPTSIEDLKAHAFSSYRASSEWKYLPTQSWETLHIELPPEVDPLGFDSRSKVLIPRSHGFDLEAIPSTEKIPILGEITGARSENFYASTGDHVYITADENLDINRIYAVTRNPTSLDKGYSYYIVGSVKVLGVKDNVYIAEVLTVRDFLPRGAVIIPMPERVPDLTPINGPSPLKGVLMIDHTFSTYTTAQHREAFIDKGSEDGVKVGMIFRIYQHKDPSNGKKVARTDFIIDADTIVTRVTEKICSVLILNSRNPVREDSPAILLTDVSDVGKPGYFEKSIRAKHFDDLDSLDQKDHRDGLQKEEKTELEQLENFKGKLPEETGPALPPPIAPRLPPPLAPSEPTETKEKNSKAKSDSQSGSSALPPPSGDGPVEIQMQPPGDSPATGAPLPPSPSAGSHPAASEPPPPSSPGSEPQPPAAPIESSLSPVTAPGSPNLPPTNTSESPPLLE